MKGSWWSWKSSWEITPNSQIADALYLRYLFLSRYISLVFVVVILFKIFCFFGRRLGTMLVATKCMLRQSQNGGHTVWMDKKKQKSAWKHQDNGFYDVPFPLLHTNHPLGKREPYSLNELHAKKFRSLRKNTKTMGLRGWFSIIKHKSHPGKTWATQFDLITSKKIRNMDKTTVEVSNLIYLPKQNPKKERNSKGFQEMILSKELCTKA